MRYQIPIPRPRGFQNLSPENVRVATTTLIERNEKRIRDMFLYALFARVAANDDENWEFETKYDAETQHIELDIPEDFMQIIEGTTKGEYFRRYIAWLFEGAGFWTYDEETNTISPITGVCFTDFAGFDEVVDNGTNTNIDWSTGNKQQVLLTGPANFTFTDPPCNGGLQIIVRQDNVGGHNITWPAEVQHPNGLVPPYTIAANSKDVWSFLFDGNNYLATLVPNFQ